MSFLIKFINNKTKLKGNPIRVRIRFDLSFINLKMKLTSTLR